MYLSFNMYFIFKVIRPAFSQWKNAGHVKSIAAGEFHALYLTTQGHLYSSGNNDEGQLGRSLEKTDDKYPGTDLIL